MAFLSNLEAALDGKKLDDLTDIEKAPSTKAPVDPTPAMIMEVIELLREGKAYRAIQLEVTHQNRILSMAQLRAINAARKEKIAELFAKENESEDPKKIKEPTE